MKMLLLVLTAFVCFQSAQAKTALSYARGVEKAMERETVDFPYVKKWADAAVDYQIKNADRELRKRGYHAMADELSGTWRDTYLSSLFSIDGNLRDIGDHKSAIPWLTEKYLAVELILGRELCRSLHISDILSLNAGVPVTIRPATFPMDAVPGERIDEYRRHFAGGPSGGDFYYGVIPVVSYYAALIGCQAAGGSILCGPVSGITERLIDIVAANLSDRVFERFNKK